MRNFVIKTRRKSKVQLFSYKMTGKVVTVRKKPKMDFSRETTIFRTNWKVFRALWRGCLFFLNVGVALSKIVMKSCVALLNKDYYRYINPRSTSKTVCNFCFICTDYIRHMIEHSQFCWAYCTGWAKTHEDAK